MVTRKKVHIKIPNFFNSRDQNEMWDMMLDKITGTVDAICPLKSYKVKGKREPWITNEAIEAIKDKDRLHRQANNTGTWEDWEEAKRCRNKVGKDLKNLRADFLRQQQEVHKAGPKKFWQTISEIIPSKKSKSGNIWLTDSNSGRDVPGKGIADHFNRFFTEVGVNLVKGYSAKWKDYGETNPDILDPMSPDTEEVIELCRKIETIKSSGLDKISSRICKDAFLALSEQLVHMFNCSLATANFPDAWKVAKIMPLFKGGDRAKIANIDQCLYSPFQVKFWKR